MGCGVLEAHNPEEHVPGSAIFSGQWHATTARRAPDVPPPDADLSLCAEDTNAAALAAYDGIDLSLLKRSPHNPDIILVPQPSAHDLRDPLLWPTWKKHVVFVILVFGTVLVGAVGPLVAADQSNIAKQFNSSLTAMARVRATLPMSSPSLTPDLQVLSSYFVLVLGIATIFFQVRPPPTPDAALRSHPRTQVGSVKFGKRPIYLSTSLLLLAATVWASCK